MKRIIIILVILGLLGIGGYTYYKTKIVNAATLADGETAFTVEKTTLRHTLTLSGKIDAEEKVTLAFKSGGRLTWLGAKEGDYVKKGQGIASLDQRELQKSLESQLNTYMMTRWDFDQTKQDNKDAPYRDGDIGDRMKRIVDKAQFGLNNSVINVELQTLTREYAYLSTPIEGVVTRMSVAETGVIITPANTFEIINPATIYFSASADQTEVPTLMVGQTAQVILDPYTDEKMLATVKSIAFTPKAGESGTVYEVKMVFVTDNNNLKYRLGMTGDAEFTTLQKNNIIAIPIQYVKTENGKKVVTKIGNGKREKIEVQIGVEGDSSIEIKSGLAPGDVIVETK
ncbi:MAG: efflux RND transporter periplasmic adaptor subunit [Candidatus Roizmanbacteria bacterium]